MFDLLGATVTPSVTKSINKTAFLLLREKIMTTLALNIQTMSSREIAQLCSKEHRNVMADIDFEEIIKAPSIFSDKDVLLFIDPPYYLPPKFKHYRYGFDLTDHQRLAKYLEKTPYNFFLTYDDCPEVRDLYKWAHIYELSFFL